MEYDEAKIKFIQAWGTLGTSWGINKAMAQIHALLLLSSESLSTEDIMNELNMSRGNANMNTRALIDWGIVYKEFKPGERKEYFYTTKDIWSLARQVVRERKKRELEPAIRVLEDVSRVKGESNDKTHELKRVAEDMLDFTRKLDRVFEKVAASDENWFYKQMLKMF